MTAMGRLLSFCTVTALIAATTVTVSAGSTPERHHAVASAVRVVQATTKPSREVFGYATSGSLGDPNWGYTSWDWSTLGTVAYFALHIADDGSIAGDSDWTIWNSSLVTSMMATAHASGARVVVTIDLQDFSSGNPHMCAGLAHAATTVAQTVATVRARGADGVSVDFEGLNGTCPNGQTSRSMMTDFVQQLRAGLGSSSYLSVATYASSASDSLGFFDIAGMSASVDSFFVMAYDLEYSNWRYAPIYCSSFCLGPTAPLSGYHYNDTGTAAEYIAVVPASKVLLGVPYYGRKSCVSSAAYNPYPAGAVTADSYLDAASESTDPSVQPGTYQSRVDAYDPAGQERWNTWWNTSLGCERQLYIDDATSLGKKYDLVNADGLRGVGIWTLNYGGGSPELWAALRGHFAPCTTITAGPSVVSPQPIGTQVQVTGSASGCASADYEFWLKPPGGNWSLAQGYSSAATLKWNTAGGITGTYRFSVWARAVGSQNSYDTFSAFDYALTPSCTAITVTATPASSAPVGAAVTLTGTAASCPNPLFEVWVLPPGGNWTLARGYAPGATISWATAGRATGSYRFSVWTRDASSSNPYDAFSAFQYTLTPVCSSVSASSVPSQAASAGNNVTITASAAGCANPQYQFWVLPPGGTWTLAQAYSTSAVLKWQSAALSAGAYRISVWARDATSSNSYDALNAFVYTLVPMCSSVIVSTSPASLASAGNTVTVTATASGCANPLYEFWIRSPDGSWTLVQSYSSGAVFKWVTAGKVAGAYRISVWVRDASSPGTGGISPNTYDAVNGFPYGLT
jgi:hypothetical protein